MGRGGEGEGEGEGSGGYFAFTTEDASILLRMKGGEPTRLGGAGPRPQLPVLCVCVCARVSV